MIVYYCINIWYEICATNAVY